MKYEDYKDVLKVGDKLKCISNEGYWSMGDIRNVTGLSDKHIKLDGKWYALNDFRWRCYQYVDAKYISYLESELSRAKLNGCALIVEHYENSIRYHKSIMNA